MTEEEKTVSIKLYLEEVPVITIKYKDKEELFKKFQKKLKQLDFPTDEIYWYDNENIHTRMRNADDVLAALYLGVAKMFARDPRNRETFPSFSSDEDEENERNERETTRKHYRKNRSRSLACARGRSRSESCHRRSRYHAKYDFLPVPFGYATWMRPPAQSMLFYDPHDLEGYRRKEEEKHNYHCK